ncbi:DUF3089 domain-containing protein [Jiulongibacter sp. NS-SX5]|uniref:DUF3089 domain-containing protein n=1 Tax=Jiulongibacter sp. NS-SX5 TaxID=3463854 RepID=UPI004059A85C
MKSIARLFVILLCGSLLLSCQKIIVNLLTPSKDFSEVTPPPAPDYSSIESWGVYPENPGYAEMMPAGIAKDDSLASQIDVFFIHPTGYFKGTTWNENINSETGTYRNTDIMMANLASIFNEARLFAPLYRQAVIATFVNMEGENESKALALAYSDVKAAFEYYIENENNGRPFILTGHSQGSYHGKLLIDDFVNNKPLSEQFVAAYLLGTTEITYDWVNSMNDIKVCNSPTETGCVINYNSFASGIKPAEELENEGVVCVNPLTWKMNGELADKDQHQGYVPLKDEMDIKLFGKDKPSETPISDLEAPKPKFTSAKCELGVLLVDDLQLGNKLDEGNYHAQDMPLFHMDIRKNYKERATAFLSENP